MGYSAVARTMWLVLWLRGLLLGSEQGDFFVQAAWLHFNFKSSQVLTPHSCKRQGACANKEGGMPTKDFARSLPLQTSRRLGTAPVRLACTQRGPKRGLVLVCSGRRRSPPHSTVALQIQRAPR
jgi:hypothetical protein